MAETIGIKIANGDFYPIIIDGNSTAKKRLVLTTVHDGQTNVQIDLFRSVSQSIEDAHYIGSVMVENITPRPKGEASIEMVIACGEDGNITADACDLDAGSIGEHHILNVSLKSVEADSDNKSFPDFDFESKPHVPASLYEPVSVKEDEKGRATWIIMALATVFVIIVIALVWFFFLGGRDMQIFAGVTQKTEQTAPPSPPVAVEKPEPVAPPPPPPPPPEPAPVVETPKPVEKAPAAENVPVIQAPTTPPAERPVVARRTRPPAPVSSYNVPAVIPKNGVSYQIRWGDTLWDISEAFYRNPWLYPQIARRNKIPDPDLIISGRTITIPRRN